MENLKDLLQKMLAAHLETTELQREMTMKMERLAKRLEREQKTFLDPDEACEVLGIRLNRSGTHRRRLKWLREHGFLTRFGSQNPYTYDSDELAKLAEKIRIGKVMVPSAC